MAEDQRIQQREDLVDRRQHERRGHQTPVVPQISVKSRHLFQRYDIGSATGWLH